MWPFNKDKHYRQFKDSTETKDEIDHLEKEWASTSSGDKWLDQLKHGGLTHGDFEKAKANLKVKLKREPSIRDVIWSIFNRLAIRDAAQGKNSGQYYAMALFVNEEGKNPSAYLRAHANAELNQWKKTGVVKTMKICAAPDSCESCRKLNGTVLDIEEAIKQQLLPCKDCTHHMSENERFPFCRCFWSPDKLTEQK